MPCEACECFKHYVLVDKERHPDKKVQEVSSAIPIFEDTEAGKIRRRKIHVLGKK